MSVSFGCGIKSFQEAHTSTPEDPNGEGEPGAGTGEIQRGGKAGTKPIIFLVKTSFPPLS